MTTRLGVRLHSFRARLIGALALGGVSAACGGSATGDEGGGGQGGEGAGGSAAGSAGSGAGVSGSGGSSVGTGGSSAGAAGTSSGSGGSSTGSGGTGVILPGDGGPAGGSGPAGSGGAGGSAGAAGGAAGAGGCTDSLVPPGGTGGTPCEGGGTYEYESCYSRETLDTLLRECAAPIHPMGCPPIRDLNGPYGNTTACVYFSDGPWRQEDACCYQVVESGIFEGRPFRCQGQVRLADTTRRADWTGESVAPATWIDAATRAALRDAWLESARAEHSSIASFARLALELLAVGAPPDLVRDAQQASIDEIEHARLGFALASRYAGEALGPGPLPLDGALRPVDLTELAVAAVTEGCIGETLAAIVAGEELAVATDRAVRDALERIAEDEARHAELSWRIVRWAIGAGGERVRAAVAAAFDSGLRVPAVPADAPALDARTLGDHGRLSAVSRRAVLEAAVRDVLAPCARRLLGEPRASSPGVARVDPVELA